VDHLIFLKTKRKKRNNKLLFTEFTYRNINFSDKEPWNSDHRLKGVNLEAQTHLFNALLKNYGMKNGLLVDICGNRLLIMKK
jgi:hypothetical protein